MRHALLLVLLVACTGGSDAAVDPSPAPAGSVRGTWSGEIDARRCRERIAPPESLRCRASGAAPLGLAVCGDLVGDNTVTVDGTLAVSGDWTVRSPARVRDDVYLGGVLDATNTVDVGATRREPMLACAEAVDVAALAARTDEAASTNLEAVTSPTSVQLGCGTYRFSRIGVDNTLTLRVEGRVVMVVEGDVRIAAPMRVELATDAELDLVVGGRLAADNTLTVEGGSAWVAVAGEVRVASPVSIQGWLVAPRGSVAGDNTLTIDGAAFTGAMRVASPLVVVQRGGVDGRGCVGP